MLDPQKRPRLSRSARSADPCPSVAPAGTILCHAGEELKLPPPPFAAGGTEVMWEQVAGPEATPDDFGIPEPRVRVPAALVNTRLTFEAIPTTGEAPTHIVNLWVSPDTDCPAAQAGPTQVVAEGEVVLLNGRDTKLPMGASASDIGWEWVQVAGPPIALSDPWSLTPAFRAPEGLVSSDVQLELRVTNGPDDGVSSISSISILVCGAETSLAVESTTPAAIAAGEVITLGAAVEAPENETLVWNWTQVHGPPLELENPRSQNPTVHLPLDWRNVDLSFEATVHDGKRAGSARVDVTVEPDGEAARVEIQGSPNAADGDLVCLEAVISPGVTGAWCSHWVQLDGLPVILTEQDSDTESGATDSGPRDTARHSLVSFVAPDVARTQVTLACVSSAGQQNAIDTIEISIEGDQDAPHVDAGCACVAAPGEEVELLGRAHGPEGRPVRILWRQVRGPRVALSNPTSMNPRFLAPSRDMGTTGVPELCTTLVFALHAFAGELESVDTIYVHVGQQDPLAPASANSAREVIAGERLHLCLWTEEQLQDLKSCAWRQVSGPPVQLMDENSPGAWFIAPDGYANTQVTFELDAHLGSRRVLETVEVMLEVDEDAPLALVAADRRARARELVRLEAFARDPSGLNLDTRWRQVSGPHVELDDPQSSRPTFAAPALSRGESLVFEFTVTDGVSTVAETARVQVDATAVVENSLALSDPEPIPMRRVAS
ncbi:MAG: hypothetical protein ACI8QS_002703 [Planctomycetota bacterium]